MERYKNDQLDQETLEQVLEKDEQETRYDRVIRHRRKVKRIRKSIRILAILIIISTISIYMLTSLSNIKILKVNNNTIYSQQEILNKASLNYNGKMLFHPVFFIEKVLEEDPLIKDTSIQKNYFSGSIYIDIIEEKVIGQYDASGQSYVLLANGKSIEIVDLQITLVSSPYIVDLSDEQRTLLADSLLDVDSEYIALISEIRHFSTSYDDNMLELLMQDGRIVRTSYNDIGLLKSYRGVLEKYNSDIRCIYFVGSNAHSESCE